MEQFLSVHQKEVAGALSTFDRLIFKGHLTRLFIGHSFEIFLAKQGILLKNFGPYVEQTTEELKAHVKSLADEAGRPFVYLDAVYTRKKGPMSKEEFARSIAQKDGITQGLICVFSTLERCVSFSVRKNPSNHRLEVVLQRRKCLHFYFYYFDAEFGFMHVRLQSWWPLPARHTGSALRELLPAYRRS